MPVTRRRRLPTAASAAPEARQVGGGSRPAVSSRVWTPGVSKRAARSCGQAPSQAVARRCVRAHQGLAQSAGQRAALAGAAAGGRAVHPPGLQPRGRAEGGHCGGRQVQQQAAAGGRRQLGLCRAPASQPPSPHRLAHSAPGTRPRRQRQARARGAGARAWPLLHRPAGGRPRGQTPRCSREQGAERRRAVRASQRGHQSPMRLHL
jgi:hypothetical protein